MRKTNQKKRALPALQAPAERLLLLCYAAILVYLSFVCRYAWQTLGDLYARLFVREMLHSAAISAVLALSGGLLLDCELRYRENCKR